jgi:hypothetical protein
VPWDPCLQSARDSGRRDTAGAKGEALVVLHADTPVSACESFVGEGAVAGVTRARL